MALLASTRGVYAPANHTGQWNRSWLHMIHEKHAHTKKHKSGVVTYSQVRAYRTKQQQKYPEASTAISHHQTEKLHNG